MDAAVDRKLQRGGDRDGVLDQPADALDQMKSMSVVLKGGALAPALIQTRAVKGTASQATTLCLFLARIPIISNKKTFLLKCEDLLFRITVTSHCSKSGHSHPCCPHSLVQLSTG